MIRPIVNYEAEVELVVRVKFMAPDEDGPEFEDALDKAINELLAKLSTIGINSTVKYGGSEETLQ